MSLGIFGRIPKILTEPIRKRAKLILIITLVMLVPIFYIEVRLPKLVRLNLDDALMLICETATESGDDFINAREDHASMLEHYLGHMGQRHLSRFLRALYPELSPEIQLKPVLENLKKPVEDQEEAREQIRGAAEALDQFIRNLEESSDIQVLPVRPEVLPDELLEVVENALHKSHEVVDEFEKKINFDNAQSACRANRRAIALLYLARFGYEIFGDERVGQFREDIKRTIYYNDVLQKTVSSRERELLRRYSHSEYRRLKIVEAVLDKDMERAHGLLTTAIKEAYKTERKVGQ